MGIGDEAVPTLGNVKLPILLQYPQRFQFAIDGISAQPEQTRGLANVALRGLVGFECSTFSRFLLETWSEPI